MSKSKVVANLATGGMLAAGARLAADWSPVGQRNCSAVGVVVEG